MRHWHDLRGPAVHGSDCNPDLDRPLAYGDGTFDLAYALSVFTHLSTPLQAFWMAEPTAPQGVGRVNKSRG